MSQRSGLFITGFKAMQTGLKRGARGASGLLLRPCTEFGLSRCAEIMPENTYDRQTVKDPHQCWEGLG